MKKVKIIVPAYNASKYIGKMIDSVLSQTYQNIEMLIVDDGSSDSTVDVVNNYINQDNRVRMVQTENHGPALARNIGLYEEYSSADYIMFCDADDYLLRTAIEKAVNAIENNGAELAILGFSIINYDGTKNKYYETGGVYDLKEDNKVINRLYKSNLLNQVWGKLFLAPVIDKFHLQFEDYHWGEDRLFVFDYMMHIHKIVIIPECEYMYVMQNGSSLVSRFHEDKFDACIAVDKKLSKLRKVHNCEEDASYEYMFTKSIFSLIVNIMNAKYTCSNLDFDRYKYIRDILNHPYVSQQCGGLECGFVAKMLCYVVRTRSVVINCLLARLAIFMDVFFPKCFQKIKHKK